MNRITGLLEQLSGPSCSVDGAAVTVSNPLNEFINHILETPGAPQASTLVESRIRTTDALNELNAMSEVMSLTPEEIKMKKELQRSKDKMDKIWDQCQKNPKAKQELKSMEKAWEESLNPFDNLDWWKASSGGTRQQEQKKIEDAWQRKNETFQRLSVGMNNKQKTTLLNSLNEAFYDKLDHLSKSTKHHLRVPKQESVLDKINSQQTPKRDKKAIVKTLLSDPDLESKIDPWELGHLIIDEDLGLDLLKAFEKKINTDFDSVVFLNYAHYSNNKDIFNYILKKYPDSFKALPDEVLVEILRNDPKKIKLIDHLNLLNKKQIDSKNEGVAENIFVRMFSLAPYGDLGIVKKYYQKLQTYDTKHWHCRDYELTHVLEKRIIERQQDETGSTLEEAEKLAQPIFDFLFDHIPTKHSRL